eukprot:8763423-Alexandrium_andersonii.AAC.1
MSARAPSMLLPLANAHVPLKQGMPVAPRQCASMHPAVPALQTSELNAERFVPPPQPTLPIP